ncbi:set domain-containing protein bromodomain-containing (plasmid) [Paraburkholderia caribensis MBA4]|uniref:Set domain-containing protein bromodomain-containing n=1 Tax=Paraburkholderia caribensis MBA4 TaxID=1323664 RepID=A0A0P0RQ55_9BURK|nr:set domain-containing protein bromodomain-containing [Paraburkholderia caribensis MBA4]
MNRAVVSGVFAHIACVAPSHRPVRDAAMPTAQCKQASRRSKRVPMRAARVPTELPPEPTRLDGSERASTSRPAARERLAAWRFACPNFCVSMKTSNVQATSN